jgi:D-alanyl-lipoteichoic acid acyltransferase DltB (MBOAT superfamily)
VYIASLFPTSPISKDNHALLAIGVSYYSFQANSYLIDIYIDVQYPEKHLGYFALYMCFFPKLLQGPIERASILLLQLKLNYQFSYENVRVGTLTFFWGLFNKVVVADRIALYVNPVYSDVQSFSGLSLILATYLYAIQLYCDFSGYTNMAIGSAKIFNIDLTKNFNSPYISTSIVDFWRRWHISFSKWILDYIFTPLQFQFRSLKRAGTAIALIITFFVSGLWHGSTYGFIVWGLLHGIYLSLSIYCNSMKKNIYKMLGIENSIIKSIWEPVYVFNIVCFSWIFFRAASISDSLYVVRNLFAPTKGLNEFLFSQGNISLMEVIAVLTILITVHYFKNWTSFFKKFFDRPIYVRWAVYYLLVISILLFNVDGERAFLYFKF